MLQQPLKVFSRVDHMDVLLDTNFLMVPAQTGVDVYELLKPYGSLATLDLCIDELTALLRRAPRSKTGRAARLALEIAEKKGLKIIRSKERYTDTGIISYATDRGCAVATNDKELIRLLKDRKTTILRLRQQKRIDVM